jgi:hypothetical protein
MNDGLPEGLVFSNTHGYFNLPRNTSNVLKFFDVGFNFHPADVDNSFLPAGMHSIWLTNYIMSNRRFERVQNIAHPNNPNNQVYSRLRHIENTELLDTMIDYYVQDNDTLADEESVRSGLRERLPVTDIEFGLLDMIQDLVELEEGEEAELSLGLDEMVRLLSRSKFSSYSIYGTNGLYANVHTGKFLVNVRVKEQLYDIMDDLEEVETFWRHAVGDMEIVCKTETIFKGMQAYQPHKKKLAGVRVRKGLLELLRFPSIVQQLFYPDQFFVEFINYQKTVDDFLRLVSLLEDQLSHYHDEIMNLTHSHVRLEFFLEYFDEPNNPPNNLDNEGSDEEQGAPSGAPEDVPQNVGGEGNGEIGDLNGDLNPNIEQEADFLDGIPNISSFIRQIDTLEFCIFLVERNTKCFQPLLKLKSAIKEHEAQGNLPNFDSYTPPMKAAMCTFAELMLTNLDMHPYSPKILKKMLVHVPAKTGSWTIPPSFRIDLNEEQKAFSELPFGVTPHVLEKRIKISDIGNILSSTSYREKSRVYIQAQKLKPMVRSSFRFCEAVENLQAVLSHFSTDDDMYLDDNLKGIVEDDLPEPFFEHTLEGRIDYNYLANELPWDRRIIMFDAIANISEALYNHSYHELLTIRKRSRNRATTDTPMTFPSREMSVADLPTSFFQVTTAVHNESLDGNVLTWTFPARSNEINNPGEKMFCWF